MGSWWVRDGWMMVKKVTVDVQSHGMLKQQSWVAGLPLIYLMTWWTTLSDMIYWKRWLMANHMIVAMWFSEVDGSLWSMVVHTMVEHRTNGWYKGWEYVCTITVDDGWHRLMMVDLLVHHGWYNVNDWLLILDDCHSWSTSKLMPQLRLIHDAKVMMIDMDNACLDVLSIIG